jgi:hypothetical protein
VDSEASIKKADEPKLIRFVDIQYYSGGGLNPTSSFEKA